MVTYDGGKGDDNGRRLALLQGSKIVVSASTFNGTDQDVLILKYNTDGSPDTVFGHNGAAIIQLGEGNDYGEGVALQMDHKIIIAGGIDNGTDHDILVLRLLAFQGGGGSSSGCFIGTVGR